MVVLSLRLDRIDNFWFVLRHEIEHVLLNHGRDRGFIVDTDVSDESLVQINEEERLANAAAMAFCIDQAAPDQFIAEVGPYVAERKALALAASLWSPPWVACGPAAEAASAL